MSFEYELKLIELLQTLVTKDVHLVVSYFSLLSAKYIMLIM